MKTPDNLQEAVRDFQQGNKESFDKLYELSYKYLYICVIHLVKDEDTAMDMLQETYMEISRSIQQLKNAEDFLSWAATIANRKCYAYLKKYQNILVYENPEDEDEDIFDNLADDEAIIPEEILQDREKQRLIKEIIDNLSDMQRLCVIGYYYNEQKQEEIAKELGIPLNTVKANLSRARAKIKEAIIDMDVKKGTRLYSLAPFMLLFFSAEAEACESKPMRFSPEEAANDETVKSKIPQTTLRTKLLIGAVILCGVMAAVVIPRLFGNQNAVPQQSQIMEETQSSESETVAEPAETNVESVIATESVQEIESDRLVSGYAISEKYLEYGLGNQGLIPVCNDQGNYGLVTYDDEIVVPLEYSSGCWMVNADGQSFFEKDGIYTVFDRDGKELFRTERTIKSINEGIVFVMDGADRPYAYYGLDGNLIYESGEDDGYQKGAVGFSEGYAFMGEGEIIRLRGDGTQTDMADIVYQENDSAQPDEGIGNVIVDSTSANFVMGICIGAAKGGYFLTKGLAASSDSYGIYTLQSVDGPDSCSWDISNIFNKENLKFSTSDASWDFVGYYDNGNVYYNNRTYMCAYIITDEKTVYYLVDVSKMTPQEYTSQGEYWSDEDYWDFDTTVLTDEALILRADYIGLNAENYWLIEQDGKWGYIDHAGTVMGIYDDATDFYGGKALVIEDGTVYVIDESFEKIKEIGPAVGIRNCGELFCVINAGDIFGQMIRLD